MTHMEAGSFLDPLAGWSGRNQSAWTGWGDVGFKLPAGRTVQPFRGACDCPPHFLRAKRSTVMNLAGSPELLVLRAVRAIDPAQHLDALVDVVISDGRIERLGPDAGAELAGAGKARVIAGRGRWVLPALVELHAHLREPGFEYKEDIASGLQAAAAGGYAHVCAMPNTKPVNDTRAVTELMLARARLVTGPQLHPIAAITVGLAGKELTEMGDLKEAGAVAVSDDGKCVMNAAVMRHALEYARNFGLPVIQHAEDHNLTDQAQANEGLQATRLGLRGWPNAAEDVIVARDLILAQLTGAHYHVAHISTRGAVELVRQAKQRGVLVTAEVAPHHLLLDDSVLDTYDPVFKVNPPLRAPEDVHAVREALADGTIDCIATDHAPHSMLEKDCEFVQASPGIIGMETCLPLMLDLVRRSVLSLDRMIEALTSAPSRVIGIDSPALKEGRIAELCLVDPQASYVLQPSMLRSKSRNCPYLGRELQGRVDLTVAQGRIVFERT